VPEILLAISEERLREMQVNIAKVWHRCAARNSLRCAQMRQGLAQVHRWCAKAAVSPPGLPLSDALLPLERQSPSPVMASSVMPSDAGASDTRFFHAALHASII